MRATIEPDRAIGVPKEPGQAVADEGIRTWIENLVEANVRNRPPHRIRRRMRLRLPLGQRKHRGIPRPRFQACGVVEWNPGVVTEVRARHAMWLIFICSRAPLPRQIDLRKS